MAAIPEIYDLGAEAGEGLPLQQGVLQRERCRGGAPAAADLVVDVRDVAVDRRDRDDQLSPDLARFQRDPTACLIAMLRS